MINWSQCPDAESVPGGLSDVGLFEEPESRFKQSSALSRIAARRISPDRTFPDLDVGVVRRILAHAGMLR
jgi:hypothetical protein